MNSNFRIVRLGPVLTRAEECDQEQHRDGHSQKPENDVTNLSFFTFSFHDFPLESGTNLTRFRDDSSERDRPQFVAPEIELPK